MKSLTDAAADTDFFFFSFLRFSIDRKRSGFSPSRRNIPSRCRPIVEFSSLFRCGEIAGLASREMMRVPRDLAVRFSRGGEWGRGQAGT